MNITIDQLIVWLLVGALAGSVVGMLVKRTKKGFGHIINLGIGLVGALIGGFLFDLFNLDLGLGQIAISFEDIVAALIGSLIFLLIVFLIRKKQ
jgi:uncharacterized membrane protein YeaQ/YmgE (transglycosylase-associated protein family)